MFLSVMVELAVVQPRRSSRPLTKGSLSHYQLRPSQVGPSVSEGDKITRLNKKSVQRYVNCSPVIE